MSKTNEWQLQLEEEKMASYHDGICEVLEYIKSIKEGDNTLTWSEKCVLNKVLTKFGYMSEE